MVRQDWVKWNLDIVFPMVYHTFYTGDASFISDCTVENVRDKNDMTCLLYTSGLRHTNWKSRNESNAYDIYGTPDSDSYSVMLSLIHIYRYLLAE